MYECQVSTEPKISARVDLKVVVPRTEIIGDLDRYVKAGSTVLLRCVVRGALEPPSYIIWYHGTQQVFTEQRRGWQIQIDRGTDIDGDGDRNTVIFIFYYDDVLMRDVINFKLFNFFFFLIFFL